MSKRGLGSIFNRFGDIARCRFSVSQPGFSFGWGTTPLSFLSFPSLSPLPSVLSPPSHLPFYPSRHRIPIALLSHKCSGRPGGTLCSLSGSGRSPAAKQFLVHFPFYTVTPHRIFAGCGLLFQPRLNFSLSW